MTEPIPDATIKQELQALHGKVLFKEHADSEPISVDDSKKLDVWKRFFGSTSPQKIVDILSKNFEKTLISLLLDDPREVLALCRSGSTYAEVTLHTDEPLSTASNYKLDELSVYGEQGKGFAKKVMANLMELNETQFRNVTAIRVGAYGVGAYAWLKFGFVPNERSWNETNYAADDLPAKKEQIALMIEQLGPNQLKPDEIKDVQAILTNRDPKSAWKLADLPQIVRDPFDDHKEKSLGKYFLIDLSWSGALDLTDPESMERFRRYVGMADAPQAAETPIRRDRAGKPSPEPA